MSARRMAAALPIAAALLVSSPAFAQAPPSVAPRANAAPATQMANPGLVAGGAIVATAGVTATALGVLFAVAASVGCLDTCSPSTGSRAITGTAIGVGIAAIAGGVVMMVRGARRVPAGESGARLALPAWAGAPAGAGWQWRY